MQIRYGVDFEVNFEKVAFLCASLYFGRSLSGVLVSVLHQFCKYLPLKDQEWLIFDKIDIQGEKQKSQMRLRCGSF